ncbi:hypothetical protein [Synechococcus sp. PCC 7336]|uniref:hypothetical protein n=1 Tax=Synechococcus sp. PCC 7336 TaxID=195250 RepID=UPI000373B198|nr:hypothetical protein [Synechococcus sp. PCC 7336]
MLWGLLLIPPLPSPNPPGQPETFSPERSERLYPAWAVDVGRRMRTLRLGVPTVDRVVLVPDTATFLEAIEQWSLAGRWPILIEDDRYTPLFLQRFQPAEIIRLPAAETPVPSGSALPARLRQAAATAWNAADTDSLYRQWGSLHWRPPGAVVAIAGDPAWPAALALAADRGQPLLFLEGNYRRHGDRLLARQWQALTAEVEAKVAATGFSYGDLGDAIETVTLVGDVPVKYAPDVGAEPRSVTDGLARFPTGQRWAVASAIAGGSERSLYQAMAAIFLARETALLYDSYGAGEPWQVYELETSARQLARAGIETQLVQRPEATRSGWLELGAEPLGFDLMWMNSLGGPHSFDVGGERAAVQDIPSLEVPLAIYLIHSFSAADPEDGNTVAGRWLENGAYFYVGSVHEPFLSAFVPPKIAIDRLLRGIPLAIASRWLDSRPWRVTAIGDPLMGLVSRRARLAPAHSPYPAIEASTQGQS